MSQEESILAGLEKLRASVRLLESLLDEKQIKDASAYLLDSYQVNKFHKDYKEWESSQNQHFLDTEVLAYNKKIGQMARMNDEIEALQREYDAVRSQIALPKFHFSLQTIEQFQGGELLEYLPAERPQKVLLGDLFLLDGTKASLDFPTFNKLVNLEYHLRLQRHIKHETLLVAKQHLNAKNQKWAARDSALNQFLSRDLPAVFEEIDKIKQNDEDLREESEELDEDMDSDTAEHSEAGDDDKAGDEQDKGGESAPIDDSPQLAEPAVENPLEAIAQISSEIVEASQQTESAHISTGNIIDIATSNGSDPTQMAPDFDPIQNDDFDDDLMNIDG